MKTTKGNELIAKFLGYEYYEPLKVYVNRPSAILPKMDFDTSWDSLMPVVSKCVNEYPEMDEHEKLLQDINNGLMDTDIQQTWNAIINFINKYNEK